MRANRLKQKWASGQQTTTCWLSLPCSMSAEMLAHAGFDSLTVDLQHGMIDPATLVHMLQAVSTTESVPLVRVPWNDPAHIMRALDAGAYGIICPMVNNRLEAESLVSACRYPPAGGRSFGPMRGLLYGGTDYADHANDTVLTMAMIETLEAFENREEIMATPGLDAVFVGPSDLSLSLTGAKVDENTPGPTRQAILEILAAAKKAGIAAGIFAMTPSFATAMIKVGYDFVACAGDALHMTREARAFRERVATETGGAI